MSKKNLNFLNLLIVLVIIIITVLIFEIVIDPVTRLKTSRDIKRWHDLENLSSAIKIYNKKLDNSFLKNLPDNNFYLIGTCEKTPPENCPQQKTNSTCLDLSPLIISGYLNHQPQDPKFGSKEKSFYYLSKKNNDEFIVGACAPEIYEEISISY